MPDYELERLKSQELEAYHRKKAAWKAYANARAQTSAAYEVMQAASEKRRSARDKLNHEFEAMVSTREQRNKIWNEYYCLCGISQTHIDSLIKEADAEHQAMLSCFAQADYEYEYGNKSLAQIYASEGRDHKDRRNTINGEVREIRRNIRHSKQRTKEEVLRLGGSGFHAAKAIFDQAKSNHQAAIAEFEILKAKSAQLKEAYDAAYVEHANIKAELRRKQTTIRAKRDHEQVSS